MIFIKMLVLFGIFYSTKSQDRFMPNLPLGEYRTVFEKIYSCETAANLSIKFNVHVNKKTLSVTELKGNLTYLIPLDDTLSLDINVASWGLTGGWKPNSLVYLAKDACSNTKKILGNSWNSILKSFNVGPVSCPVAAGTYVTSGFNLKELEDHNFPKVYFYGKYKMFLKLKNNEQKLLSCTVVELSLIRPWEKPI
ncbi:uncharacterized protein LOC111040561 [Myzus persicae]|uniref:uncharacterized protein LOC111040561 n=1 Tax=Myzus persicae TaxID=13164 RepID=UPI000B9383C8|nr:uncharacterized protein LOC111040561 [Myzus persicae]